MPLLTAYAVTQMQNSRRSPSLPFGWSAITVLLIGTVLTIIGVVLIIYGMMQFFSGTIGSALSDNFSIGSFFSGFFGAVILFVVGGLLAGAGGWMIRLWWVFLIVGAVAGGGGGSTVRERDEARAGDVRVRCRSCGRLNPEVATYCMSCSQPL